MAKVVQLKDSSQAQVFPVTKERAVFTEDGKPAINKPIATQTTTYGSRDTPTARAMYTPISLTEGYYVVHISGVLDPDADGTVRVTKERTLNNSDVVRLLGTFSIKSTEFTCSFYLSAADAVLAAYVAFTQNTALGGTLTMSVYNADQLRWKVDSLNSMTYKPLASG